MPSSSCGKSNTGSQPSSQASSQAPSTLLRPTNTRVIQLLKRPRTVVNHSYVDYSLVPHTIEDNALPDGIEEMDFHQKLHHILGRSDTQELATWLPHGRAFRVLNPAQFETVLCPVYFGHNRYSSFLHQLGIHGYKLLHKGENKNAYYSQLFLRGLPHLTKFMAPPLKVFRRMSNDIENEPDLSLIQLIAPLPSDERFGKPLTIEDVIQFCRATGRDERLVLEQFDALLQSRGNPILMQSISDVNHP